MVQFLMQGDQNVFLEPQTGSLGRSLQFFGNRRTLAANDLKARIGISQHLVLVSPIRCKCAVDCPVEELSNAVGKPPTVLSASLARTSADDGHIAKGRDQAWSFVGKSPTANRPGKERARRTRQKLSTADHDSIRLQL
jgi:hypothetical protein